MWSSISSRRHGHGLGQIAVGVMCFLRVGLRVIDDSFYVGDVGDMGDVDVAYMLGAAAICRNIDFSRSEWKPTSRWFSSE